MIVTSDAIKERCTWSNIGSDIHTKKHVGITRNGEAAKKEAYCWNGIMRAAFVKRKRFVEGRKIESMRSLQTNGIIGT